MVLVCGPPCSGKTTWVREQAQPGDVIVDYDDIAEGLGAVRYEASPDITSRARRLWLERIPGADWVIWASPTRQQRAMMRKQYGCHVVVMDTEKDVCLARAKERPDSTQAAIHAWFAAWQPSHTRPEVHAT